METAVSENRERHRYEVAADGELAGVTAYEQRPGLVAFMHTEIRDEFEGHGPDRRQMFGLN